MLTYLKMAGLDLELEADFCKTSIQMNLIQNNQKDLIAARKSLIKLYYPDMKDADESLLEELQQRIVNDPNKTLKIGISKNTTLSPTEVNKMLGN